MVTPPWLNQYRTRVNRAAPFAGDEQVVLQVLQHPRHLLLAGIEHAPFEQVERAVSRFAKPARLPAAQARAGRDVRYTVGFSPLVVAGLVEHCDLPAGFVGARAVRPGRGRHDDADEYIQDADEYIQSAGRILVRAERDVNARRLVEIGQDSVRHVNLPARLHVLAPVGDDVGQFGVQVQRRHPEPVLFTSQAGERDGQRDRVSLAPVQVNVVNDRRGNRVRGAGLVGVGDSRQRSTAGGVHRAAQAGRVVRFQAPLAGHRLGRHDPPERDDADEYIRG